MLIIQELYITQVSCSDFSANPLEVLHTALSLCTAHFENNSYECTASCVASNSK